MPTYFVWVTGVQVCFFTSFQIILMSLHTFFKKEKEILSSSNKQAKAKTHSHSLWHPGETNPSPLSQGFLRGFGEAAW